MIVVTGATGQLGRMIVENLLQTVEADDLAVFVRSPEKVTAWADKGVAVYSGDYEDSTSLESAFQGADVLMFISNTDFDRRAEQHKNVVDAAKAAGVRRIVYTSIVAEDPNNPLVASHLVTEQQIKASGIPYTFLRNNFYMDLYVSQVAEAIQKGVYRSPSEASNGAAFVSRADIARMATAVLVNEGHEDKIYNLTGPEIVTPIVFADVASKISGKKIEYQPISWDELAQALRDNGVPEQFIQMSLMITRVYDSNILARVSNDIEMVTGVPATSFLEFAKVHLPEN